MGKHDTYIYIEKHIGFGFTWSYIPAIRYLESHFDVSFRVDFLPLFFSGENDMFSMCYLVDKSHFNSSNNDVVY